MSIQGRGRARRGRASKAVWSAVVAVLAAAAVASGVLVTGPVAGADPSSETGPTIDFVNADDGLVIVGEIVTWTISTSNQTAGDLVSPSVTIAVPAGLELTATDGGGWACSDAGTAGPTTVTCVGPTAWPSGAQHSLAVSTTATEALGWVSVTASGDPGDSSNLGFAELVDEATAAMAASVSPNVSPQPGAQITVTSAVTFSGAAPRYAYMNVNGPTEGLVVDDATVDHGLACTVTATDVWCGGDGVPAGATVTLTVVATVTAADGASLWLNVYGGAGNVVVNPGTGFRLLVGGVTLSGRVTVADEPYTDTPIANACVNVSRYDDGTWIAWASTDASGSYALAVPANGTYRIQYSDCSQPARYAQGYYENTIDWGAATPVVVGTAAVTGLDQRLLGGRFVGGTVRDPQGLPAANVQVALIDGSTGSWVSGATTGPDGSWTTWSPVPPGTYLVYFDPEASSLSDQWWDGATSYVTATPLVVEAGAAPITGIDADLREAVSIAGTVGSSAGGVEGLCVVADASDDPFDFSNVVASAQSGPGGTYTLAGLPAGLAVKVFVRDCRPQPTLGYGYYTASGPTSDFSAAASVTGPATGIDVTLGRGASVSGRVVDALTGQPLSDVCAAVVSLASRVPVFVQPIDADGTFTLGGLPPGTYYAASGDCERGTRPLEWYDGGEGIPFDAEADIDPVGAGARPIRVREGATVTGIDFRLGPAAAAPPSGPDEPGVPPTSGTPRSPDAPSVPETPTAPGNGPDAGTPPNDAPPATSDPTVTVAPQLEDRSGTAVLAFTGAHASTLVGVALVLLVVGALSVWCARRSAGPRARPWTG